MCVCVWYNEGCYRKFLVEKLSKLSFEKKYDNGTKQHEKKWNVCGLITGVVFESELLLGSELSTRKRPSGIARTKPAVTSASGTSKVDVTTLFDI